MIINLVLFFIPKRQEIYRLYLIKKRKKLACMRLNSNRLRSSENIVSASDLAEDVLIKCDYGEIRLFTIQSTVSVDQGSPDGRGGFLLVYQSKSGREYGIVVLFSYANAIWMKTKSATWSEWKKIQLS